MNIGDVSRTIRNRDPQAEQPERQLGTSLFLRRDFSEQALRKLPEPQFGHSQMAAARREGFDAGLLAGLAEAETSTLANQARAVGAIATAMADASIQASRVTDGAAAALAALLVATMRAVMPDLIRRSALGEVGAMLAHVLPGLARQPRVDVEVSSTIVDGVAAVLAVVAPDGTGRIVLRGSEIMEPGGISMSWSAGEARRRPAEVWRAVMDVIDPVLGNPEPKDATND